jgi:hypothetical protein
MSLSADRRILGPSFRDGRFSKEPWASLRCAISKVRGVRTSSEKLGLGRRRCGPSPPDSDQGRKRARTHAPRAASARPCLAHNWYNLNFCHLTLHSGEPPILKGGVAEPSPGQAVHACCFHLPTLPTLPPTLPCAAQSESSPAASPFAHGFSPLFLKSVYIFSHVQPRLPHSSLSHVFPIEPFPS